MAAPEITPEEFFAGHPQAARVYDGVRALVQRIGPFSLRVTRSQVAFHRRTGFAYFWMPGRWLRNPASGTVLSIALPRHDPSPRFKEVAHPSVRVWMHHLEIRSLQDLDAEVEAWLWEAYQAAGRAGG